MRPAPVKILALFCALAALPGCAVFSDEPHYRGIAVTQAQLGQLTPGVSTEADAESLLGPPTFAEQFAPNNFVYVSQITKMRIGQTEGVKAQHVVVLSFDDNGTLQNISQKTLKNSVQVAMEAHQTPVPGGKASLMQQLIGGVGTYNPLGTTAAAGGSGAGAGGLGGSSSDIGGAGGGGGF